jgi:ankyrin repeat protein
MISNALKATMNPRARFLRRTLRWLILPLGLLTILAVLVYRRVEQKRLNSLLIIAARKGHGASVDRLLREGADPNAREDERVVPSGFIAQVRSLFATNDQPTNRQGTTALVLAAEQVDLPSVQALLRAGASVNARDDLRYTALMRACGTGGRENDFVKAARLADKLPLKEVLDLLLSAGADPNLSGHDGGTALILVSMWSDRTDCADLLLKHGAALEQQDLCAGTALFHALNTRQLHMTQFLLSRGARADSYPKYQGTKETTSCLLQALSWGNLKIIGSVLDRGGKIDAKDLDGPGGAVIYWVGDLYHSTLGLKYLLSKRPNTKTSVRGYTALKSAREAKNWAAVKLLKEYGYKE